MYIKNFYTVIFSLIEHCLTTADINAFMYPFTAFLLCLPWQRRYRKHFCQGCRTKATAEASYDRGRP